jgi:ABC-type nitrate/sulfonate/bicarbonate transport system permease component
MIRWGSARRWVLGAAGLAAILVAWGLTAWATPLPSPWAVLLALGDGFVDPERNWAVLAASTVGRGLAGWALGGGLGIAAGLMLASGGAVSALGAPAMAVFGGAAAAAFAPLLLYWGGFGSAAELLLAAWLAFFPACRAARAAFAATPPGWHDLMRGYSASRLDILLTFRLPAALPGLCAGLRRAWPAALTGAVVAEFLGAPPSGLAAWIAQAEAALDLAGAIAGFAVLAALAGLVALALGGLEAWARAIIAPTRPSP